MLEIDLNKSQQSSDWSASNLSKNQIKYASHDVIFLLELKKKLSEMLERENRLELSEKLFSFLQTRVELDLSGWIDTDIFHINIKMNLKTGIAVIDIEIKSLLLLKKKLSKSFNDAVELLYKTNGKIVVSGIGKSGHIASKISSTLSSIGSPSFFIHPSEANHGDLGMITKKDAVILISNSGETLELSNIILHCKKLQVPIVSITSEKDSTLAKKSELVLEIPKGVEACPLELAPTSSTTCTLVLGDALALALLKKGILLQRTS